MEGIKRIKDMVEGQKDKALLKVVEYLLSRSDMDEKYLNVEKSLKQMADYIKGEAKKQAVDGVAVLEDEEVYSLAIHYFDEPNETLGIKKEEIKKNLINKRENKTNAFGSIFDVTEGKKSNKQKEDVEQINLFSSIFAA